MSLSSLNWKQMRIATILKHLSELEQAAADLYEWYAKIFDDIPEAVAFFESMKRQEIDHRNIVDFQRRLTIHNSGTFDDIELDVSEIQAAIAAIEAHISGGVFDLQDALDFACALERSAAETHYKNAASKSNPELARLMRTLAKHDNEHHKKMEDFAARMAKRR